MNPSSPMAENAATWLDQRHYADLDPRAERALRAAGMSWYDEAQAERLLGEAEQIAPRHMAVVVAQYRYRLYKHRFQEAERFAHKCLSFSSAELGFPEDFRLVTSAHADFADPDSRIRFWLFALQAYGYVLLRCGRGEEGMTALRKVTVLDRNDQTKTRVLVDVIVRAGREEEIG
ncbi:MAG: hypothetical protein ABSC94_27190 [Polyangiaceae bacterium]|jgi:hypothetical protein